MDSPGTISKALFHALTEITYYRYLFPESYYESVVFGGILTRSLVRGVSPESDRILSQIEGACNSLTKGLLSSLAIGISLCPENPTFVRELYTFKNQFNTSCSLKRGNRSPMVEISFFLNRFIALLRMMELAPISTSMQMMLLPHTPTGYTPQSFTQVPVDRMECYSTFPQYANARVAKAQNNSAMLRISVLSVEGPIQIPPLGSTLCSLPTTLISNSKPGELAFVATSSDSLSSMEEVPVQAQFKYNDVMNQGINNYPGLWNIPTDSSEKRMCECENSDANEKTWYCSKCNRRCHTKCYELDSLFNSPLLTCIDCRVQAADIKANPPSIKRLAVLRRIVCQLNNPSENTACTYHKAIGCSRRQLRMLCGLLETLGMVIIDRSIRPYQYRASLGMVDIALSGIFNGDIEVAWSNLPKAEHS